ncbi:Yippee domain-containing protein [Rhizoctonia solani AG-1 IA]|uniref:Yippee domain-containing protein n=1 Tax=Thanatephorus cucumeris (strain AG1-IA) TaxID=983506 RepID=L8WNX2_THACA|nr:Yippee domain-containing protein [Rhizoctonia solani AG-1 IA]
MILMPAPPPTSPSSATCACLRCSFACLFLASRLLADYNDTSLVKLGADMPSRRTIVNANTDPTEVVSIFNDRPCYCCLKCSAPLIHTRLSRMNWSPSLSLAVKELPNRKVGRETTFVRLPYIAYHITCIDDILRTGYHTVADIYCIGCGTTVGWTYLKAHELSQKYKEGKYIVEKERIMKENAWSVEES